MPRNGPFYWLEAAAAGTPIVATDVGGTVEILRDGETARLFAAGAPEQLAAAIQQSLGDFAESKSLVERARCFVAEGFKIENQANELFRFWSSVN